jgi:hypothetical protein
MEKKLLTKEMLLAKIKEYPLSIFYESMKRISGEVLDIYLDDEDVIKASLEQDYEALKLASDRLKDNKELAILSVKNHGLTLKFVSDRLKNDKEVVKFAVLKNPSSLICASNAMQNDRELLELFEVHYLLNVLNNKNSQTFSEKYISWSKERIKTLETFREKDNILEKMESSKNSTKLPKF